MKEVISDYKLFDASEKVKLIWTLGRKFCLNIFFNTVNSIQCMNCVASELVIQFNFNHFMCVTQVWELVLHFVCPTKN